MDQDERSIVVIGASAGGIQALLAVIAELPDTCTAAFFVVVHVGAGRSMLPTLLTRAGPLTATHATDGEPIRPGHIYVAPSDYHMLVREDRVELSHGPKENHSRPAVDPLFRSAARAHGRRVTGVILSGALSDGAAGLVMIKHCGGKVIVQDPADAIVGGMPQSALRLVDADYVLSANDIGRLLATGRDHSQEIGEDRDMDRIDEPEHLIRKDFAEQEQDRRAGQLTMYTCPDCGGTLWQADAGPLLRFQCHVGHAWGPEVLLGLNSDELEAALWSSVRLLEERATLTRQVAVRMREAGEGSSRTAMVQEQAVLDERRAGTLREMLSASLGVASQVVLRDEVGTFG